MRTEGEKRLNMGAHKKAKKGKKREKKKKKAKKRTNIGKGYI